MPEHQMNQEKKLPRQLAIALQYDADEDSAPCVIAKGRGLVAEKILEVAAANQVPIREDKDLAEVLGKLDLGDFIPAELFPAIAEILAYVYKMNTRFKKGIK